MIDVAPGLTEALQNDLNGTFWGLASFIVIKGLRSLNPP